MSGTASDQAAGAAGTPAALPLPSGPPALSLPALAVRFLRFGLGAFGGPVVQIAALHQQLVVGERWVDADRFRRALAVYQALPGPEATELCIWFGTVARGRLGGLVAGLGFMLPGCVLMLLASTLLLGDTVWPAWLAAAIGGMQAGVVGIVLRAVWRLGRATAGHHREGLAIAGGASLGAACGVPFAVGLLGGAAVMLALQLPRRLFAYGGERRGNPALLGLAVGGWLFVAWLTASPTPATTAGNTAPLLAAAVTPTALELGTTGLRAGLLSFGGAYTTIPFLQADAVGPPGWMSEAQFVAGLSVGSVLPAPLVIVGTWVGFAGGGWPGALLLTLGIFGPAFLFPLLLHHQLERLVANRALHACLDGIAAAVLGLLVVTAGQLATGLWERDAGALWLGGLALAVVATWQHRLATPLALLACALLAAGTRGPA